MDLVSTLPVAVVIPCFNDGATLMEAVESVLPERPAELVVVDDGSTDQETLSVLTSLRASGANVIHQENQGVSAARMRGVDETTSPLVMALDADDMVAPGALRAMATALMADPTLDLVWGDVESVAGPRRRVHPKAPFLDPWRITFMNELVASTMIRRVSLLDAGGWRSGIGYEDWDLWMAMAERGMQGRRIDRVTLLYRPSDVGRHATDMARHAALLRALRLRHLHLFAARKHNRRDSSASTLLRVLWTLIDTVPLPQSARRYLLFAALIASEPSRRRRVRRKT